MARPGPALFELIRGGSAPPPVKPEAAPPNPLVKVTPKPGAPAQSPPSSPPSSPVSSPLPPAAEPAPAAPAERAWAKWSKGASLLDMQRSVTVPMSAILLAVGIGFAVLVITWGIAWKVGWVGGEAAIKRDLGPTVKPDAIPLNQGLITGSPKAPEPRSQPVVERRPTAPPTTGVPAGADPRVAGLNYRILASGLDKETASKIAAFLTENGLPSGAAVDRKPGGSNNAGSYVVFPLKGITPEEYKHSAPARVEVDTQSARLGKLWKDRKGHTDFSGAYWQKFAG